MITLTMQISGRLGPLHIVVPRIFEGIHQIA